MENPDQIIRELQSKIKLLEHENEFLTQKAEENLLLNRAFTDINSCDDSEVFMQEMLESVSVLLDVQFAAVFERVQEALKYQSGYSLYVGDEPINASLELSDHLLNSISKGKGFFWNSDSALLRLQIKNWDFKPDHAVVVVSQTAVPEFYFVFANGPKEAKLDIHLELLEKVIGIFSARYQSYYYRNELKQLNTELEEKVKQRTQELYQAKLSLEEKEERLATTLESIGDGVIATDTMGRVISMNSVAETMCGIKLKDAKNQPLSEVFRIVNAYSRQPTEDPVKKVLKTGAVVGLANHTVLLALDDQEYQIADSAAPILNRKGETTGVVLVFSDVTKNYAQAESLRLSEKKYRLLFENMTAGFALHEMIYDANGKPLDYRYLEANPKFESLTGVQIKDLLGRTVKECMPETEQYWIDVFGKVAQTGEPVSYQNYAKEIGKHFDVFAFSPQQDQFAVVFVDITERRQAEALYQDLVETSQDLIWQCDAQGRFVYLNNAWETTLGYKVQDMLGRPFTDFQPKETASEDLEILVKLLKKETVKNRESVYIHKNGSLVDLVFNAKIMLNPSNEVQGIRGTAYDVTNWKKSQEALSNMQKLESLGVLAGGLAHDFNNLMAGVYGFIDLAYQESQNALVEEYLQQARGSIDRARALTQQLLTFAKGGSPDKHIQSLVPFLKETVQFALSGSSISCRFNIVKDLWSCDYDKNQMAQVIDNLVINAQHAMPNGGLLQLHAQNLRGSEVSNPLLKQIDYIKISIEDKGIGISPEILPRIFDPFFTTKSKGHGLGLATCYSIVHRHGGYIEAESEVGKGSTFHLYLPASLDLATIEISDPVLDHKGKGVFLVMDDEEVIRETFRAMLSSFGYTVVTKNKGEDAVEYVKSEAEAGRCPVAMLFDLTISGGMGGQAAIAEVRKINSSVPVFVVSGYADDPVIRSPLSYGFTASLCKPFMQNDLKRMLQNHMPKSP
jgi:PAS domain S-box-containing protein